MIKPKILNFLKKILYSSFFLWMFLIFLKEFNLKPEIKVSLFLFLSLSLFLIIFFRQILIFSILSLNRFNILLKISKKRVKIRSENPSYLLLLLLRVFLKLFIQGFSLFLKFILSNYFFWLILGILVILLDIFVFKFTSYFLILFLTSLWILYVHLYKIKGKVSIGLTLGFLILCLLFSIFKKELIVEKTAIWVYVFLAIGVTQMIIECVKGEKKSV